MTIKTLAAVIGNLAIIVVLFFITKVTIPSSFLAKAGFFDGRRTTDDWGGGTGATGFWEYQADAAKSTCFNRNSVARRTEASLRARR